MPTTVSRPKWRAEAMARSAAAPSNANTQATIFVTVPAMRLDSENCRAAEMPVRYALIGGTGAE